MGENTNFNFRNIEIRIADIKSLLRMKIENAIDMWRYDTTPIEDILSILSYIGVSMDNIDKHPAILEYFKGIPELLSILEQINFNTFLPLKFFKVKVA